MKRLLLALLLVLIPASGFGQGVVATANRRGATLPGTCSEAQTFQLTTTHILYTCGPANTWTPAGSGGSAFIGGSGTAGKIAKFTGSTAVGDSLLTESGALVTVGGSTFLNGGHKIKRTATATSYTVLASDYYVGVTDTSAARTITLPDLTTTDAGFETTIADESNGALTNNISIAAGGSDTFLAGITGPVVIDVSNGVATLFWTGTSSTCCWRIK